MARPRYQTNLTALLLPRQGPDALSLTEARNACTTTIARRATGRRQAAIRRPVRLSGRWWKSSFSTDRTFPTAMRGAAGLMVRRRPHTGARLKVCGRPQSPPSTPRRSATRSKRCKARTAEKTRVRVKAVLYSAKAKGVRSGENPAARQPLCRVWLRAPKAIPHPSLPWANAPSSHEDWAAIDTPASRGVLTGLRFSPPRAPMKRAARSGKRLRAAIFGLSQPDAIRKTRKISPSPSRSVLHCASSATVSSPVYLDIGRHGDQCHAGPSKEAGGKAVARRSSCMASARPYRHGRRSRAIPMN